MLLAMARGVQWMERVKRCVVVMGGMCLSMIEVAYLAAEERSLGIGVWWRTG